MASGAHPVAGAEQPAAGVATQLLPNAAGDVQSPVQASTAGGDQLKPLCAASSCEHDCCTAEDMGAKCGAGLKAEAEAFLDHDAKRFELRAITLGFRSQGVEAEYLLDVARRRWPVLVFIFCFDVLSYMFRTTAKILGGERAWQVAVDVSPQLLNMGVLYTFVGLLNRRSRKLGHIAARQEELLLCGLMAAAVTFLLTSLTPDNAQDYVLMTYFLITTTTFLKLRWYIGAAVLALPVVVVWLQGEHTILPQDGVVHVTMAWAVGALMAYLAESYRRQMFANHKLALLAAEKEILQMRKHSAMQRELTQAQAQAATRALCVAREKAANEAKSDFMSLMCHEVRTPLNGALASVEMLLETPLEEEQRELATTIRVSGSILLSTVSNFLDFFKLEAGKQLDVVRRDIDVRQLVKDVHCIIEAMIGRSDDLMLLPPELLAVPATVMGDPDRLCGILLNLYTNAAKFTKRGCIALRVHACTGDHVPDPAPAEALYRTWGQHRCSSDCDQNDASRQNSCEWDGLVAAGSAEPVAGARRPAPSRLGGCYTHPSTREDGLRVWERRYPAEDGSRVRRRLSAEHTQEGATPWHSLDGRHTSLSWDVSSGSAAGLGEDDRRHSFSAESGTEPARQQLTSRGSDRPAGGPKAVPREAGSVLALQDRFLNSSSGLPPENSARQEAARGGAAIDTTAGGAAGARAARGSMVNSYSKISGGWRSVVREDTPKPGAGAPPGGADASSSGGAGGGATNAGGDQKQWLVFEVIDTGNGISSNGLQKLFSQYEQGTDVRKPRQRGGTGLGLSICSKQVSVLGGKIGAISRPDHGSIFWFTIPLVLPHARAAPSPGPRQPQPQSPELNQPQAAPSPFSAPAAMADVFDRLRPGAATAHPLARGASSSGGGGGGRPTGAHPLIPPSRNGNSNALHSICELGGMHVASTARGAGSSGGRAAGPAGGAPGAPSPPGGRQSGDGASGRLATAGWTIASRRSLDRRESIDTTMLQGRRVLLAEDNLINQTVARKMLTGMGLECVVASNGVEAVNALCSPAGPAFDVVLMDMMMPTMGGVQATKILRERGCPVPIVAMTANASDKDRDECLDAGMDGFLSKPVLKDRLAEAICAVLQGRCNFSDECMPSHVFDTIGS